MLHYNRNLVLAAFRAAHPDDLEIDAQTITDFDTELFEMYDARLREQAAQSNIPVNKFNLSMLAFFAHQSGGQLVATRVRHAIRFFHSVEPQP